MGRDGGPADLPVPEVPRDHDQPFPLGQASFAWPHSPPSRSGRRTSSDAHPTQAEGGHGLPPHMAKGGPGNEGGRHLLGPFPGRPVADDPSPPANETERRLPPPTPTLPQGESHPSGSEIQDPYQQAIGRDTPPDGGVRPPCGPRPERGESGKISRPGRESLR